MIVREWWTSRRSRGSTTPCTPGSWRPGPPSGPPGRSSGGGPRAGRLRPGGPAELHCLRSQANPEHAIGLQARLPAGGPGERPAHAERRAFARPPHRDRGRRRRPAPGRSRRSAGPDGTLTFSKLDAVFKSGNATRDTIPSHLVPGSEIDADLARFYAHVCPAGVYESTDGGLRINPPNCVDCKATDVLGPRWMPREGGSGPRYRLM